MTHEPTYSYDKEADILSIAFSPGEKATSAVELNPNILLRFNRAEKRAIGLTLMDFSILIEHTRLGPRSFPLTGLIDLDEDWQELVLDILNQPPVNQILKTQLFTPSLAAAMPTATVGTPSIPVLA